MVAQVAADEPDTAAKMVQPITLVCSSPPGRRLTHGARPLNMLSLSLVRNKISPIHTNNGRAVSVQLDDEPQVVTAIASPAARDEKSCMAIHATPDSVRPIQTPDARMAKSEKIKMEVIARSDMFNVSFYSLCSISSVLVSWRLPKISSTHSSMKAIKSTTDPMPIDNCGIHRGVASVPVEMSLN